MKIKFLLSVLMLMGSFYAHAEEPNIVVETLEGDVVAVNGTRIASTGRVSGAADHNESCRCWCTAQGILLRECDGETENLGNYGNIANCNKHMESEPQCK